jgi:2-hydroxychromene-2-carboxylate isomerase
VAERPRFWFDIGSPWCWLAAEGVNHELDQVPEWVPVLAAELPGAADAEPVDRAAVDRRASELGLPEVRWPDPFPFDSRTAMLAATFAKQSGRAVAFSLAAMRQAFAAGRDLSATDNVLLAAAACELHPRALLKGIELRSVTDALREATEEAAALGIGELPAVSGEASGLGQQA